MMLKRKQDVGRIRFETYLITFKQRSPLHFNILIQQSIMRILGNIIWWIFGGLEAAIGYFTGSLALAITIIGIPAAVQTFKLGLLCLWPFGAEVRDGESLSGCITIPLNIIWIIFGGLWACLTHILFGILLAITIIGIPFAKQHFKMAGLSLAPFGKDVELHL